MTYQRSDLCEANLVVGVTKVQKWIGGAVAVVVIGGVVGLCGRCARQGTAAPASQPIQGFQIVLEERNPWAENDDRLCDIHGARHGDIVVAQGKNGNGPGTCTWCGRLD